MGVYVFLSWGRRRELISFFSTTNSGSFMLNQSPILFPSTVFSLARPWVCILLTIIPSNSSSSLPTIVPLSPQYATLLNPDCQVWNTIFVSVCFTTSHTSSLSLLFSLLIRHNSCSQSSSSFLCIYLNVAPYGKITSNTFNSFPSYCSVVSIPWYSAGTSRWCSSHAWLSFLVTIFFASFCYYNSAGSTTKAFTTNPSYGSTTS